MNSIITVLTLLSLSFSAYAETVSIEPSSSSKETFNPDTIDQTLLSPEAYKDIVIYNPGSGLETNKADACDQCTIPNTSSEPDSTSH